MGKQNCRYCTQKKRKMPGSDCRKIGLLMLLFGAITVMSMFLPLKFWIIMLCAVLIVFGILLIKK